jgi:hypothetical protein
MKKGASAPIGDRKPRACRVSAACASALASASDLPSYHCLSEYRYSVPTEFSRLRSFRLPTYPLGPGSVARLIR